MRCRRDTKYLLTYLLTRATSPNSLHVAHSLCRITGARIQTSPFCFCLRLGLSSRCTRILSLSSSTSADVYVLAIQSPPWPAIPTSFRMSYQPSFTVIGSIVLGLGSAGQPTGQRHQPFIYMHSKSVAVLLLLRHGRLDRREGPPVFRKVCK